MSKTISQLTESTAVVGTDLIEISQDAGGGSYVSKKIQIDNVSKTLPYPNDGSGLFSHTPTFYHAITHMWSSGSLHGFELTDNLDGTVDLLDGDILLRDLDTSDPLGNLKEYHIATTTNLPLTNNSTNYIYADYNGGSPLVSATVTLSNISGLLKCLLYIITRQGTMLSYLQVARYTSDFINKNVTRRRNQSWIEYGGSGSIVSESGTRKIAITAGKFYFMNEEKDTSAFDSNVSDTFTIVYKNGASSWSETSGQSVLGYTQYNRLSDNTIQNLGSHDFGVYWVYWCLKDSGHELYIVYGQADYPNLSSAEVATSPLDTNLPYHLRSFSTSILIAKIVIRQNQTTFVQVDTPFTVFFVPTSVTIHNGLGGLQGGTVDEYYHLTSAEYTILQNGIPQVVVNSYSGAQILTTANYFVKYTGAGGHTFTMPAANAAGSGFGNILIIKHSGSGILTVSRAGADTIDGNTSLDMVLKDSVTLISDGVSNWSIT